MEEREYTFKFHEDEIRQVKDLAFKQIQENRSKGLSDWSPESQLLFAIYYKQESP